MLRHIKKFCAGDDGAMTVEWVVLCAGLVGLAIAVMDLLTPTVEGIGTAIKTELSSVD